ncbi:MAG TPA: hypothetical protein VE760_04100, partial [Acidimicrobiales bacterium]|nr:hypothetical protein [Acidimicrobiales bacterium]
MPMKDIFGKKGRTKEDLDREAQREVERLTRQASRAPYSSGGGGAVPGQFGTPGGGIPTPLDRVAESVRGRSAQGGSARETGPGPGLGSQFRGGPGFAGAPPPTLDADDPFYDDDDLDEAASVTQIALRDRAAQAGARPEDFIIRQDPVSAEEMRDRAMRQFFEQQEARRRQTAPPSSSDDPLGGVLARLAAKQAEKEARGQTSAADVPAGGVLGRLRREREQQEQVEEEEVPPPTRARAARESRTGRPESPRAAGRRATADDEDEVVPPVSLRERAAARRRGKEAPPRVFAVPGSGGDDEKDESDEAFVEETYEDEAYEGPGLDDDDEDEEE